MHYPLKGINWDEVGLGTVTDTVIAAELGVAPQVVQRTRARRSSPSFYSAQALRTDDVDWDSVGLGERPDSVIAREVGVSRRKVCAKRLKRRIPPFVGLVLTQEGSPCRSIYEAMYDAWLHNENMAHAHEVSVPGTRFIADFLVGDEFVEIAGMLAFTRYRAKYERKRRTYRDAQIAVRWLSSQDVERLYAECPIPLRFRSERVCLDCGKATHDLVKAVCRPCYMKRWHLDEAAPGLVATAAVSSIGKETSSVHGPAIGRALSSSGPRGRNLSDFSARSRYGRWHWISESARALSTCDFVGAAYEPSLTEAKSVPPCTACTTGARTTATRWRSTSSHPSS